MILVTGITGHTGRHFLARLQREMQYPHIRCIVRASSNIQSLDDSNMSIEKYYGDLRDIPFLKGAMQGIDTVVHIVGIHRSKEVYEVAVYARVKRLILVHTTGRYSKYKIASSEYIEIEDSILSRKDGIDVTILRPTMIYGSSLDRNIWKLIDYLNNHNIYPIFGKGTNLMQPVNARDLGNAYFDVLLRPEITANKQYNLSGGKAITYLELVKTISRELGKKHLFFHLPLKLSVALVYVYNLFIKHAQFSVEQVLRMNEDGAYSYADAHRDFGYSPVDFAEGIKDEVKEYLALPTVGHIS
ncbi:MAG: NAD-dependent epimerase/dehydratase family protein [Armatimonadota bacterium]